MEKILITGSTGTIGRVVARSLASLTKSGVQITLHCHSSTPQAQELAGTLELAGAVTHVLSADLSKTGAPAKLVSDASGKMGGLDILIHMASSFRRTPFETVTEDEWDRVILEDLRPAFFLAQEAAKIMKNGGGQMIFFSDTAALRPYSQYLPYCMAKAGIETLTRGLAKTLAPKIRVNAIAPYIVTRTNDVNDKSWSELISKTPMQKAADPNEIASVIKMLITSDTMTGQVITVDGGRSLL